MWGDPWLKGRNDAFIRSPIVSGNENMKVGELLRETRDGWNEELVDSIFTNLEATLIKKVVVYNMSGEDKLIWWRSRNSLYWVRSAYFGPWRV